MNWGAAVLLLVGGAVVVIGVSGSQKSVCQALTGSDCTWLPNAPTETATPVGTKPGGLVEPPGAINIDKVISNCKGSTQCSSYMSLATGDAQNYGIDSTDFVRQIAAESSFNPNAKSPAGALGIAQLMPSTAAQFNVNPLNPTASLNVAAQLMGYYKRYWENELGLPGNNSVGGSVSGTEVEALSLSSYNMGLGGTQSLVNKYGVSQGQSGQQNMWLFHAPQETQNYISEIMYPGTP